jgi:hypothetical protein
MCRYERPRRHIDGNSKLVTLMGETLARIKPTDPLRITMREARKKRNCSDSSGNSPAKILASRCACKKSSLQSPHRATRSAESFFFCLFFFGGCVFFFFGTFTACRCAFLSLTVYCLDMIIVTSRDYLFLIVNADEQNCAASRA